MVIYKVFFLMLYPYTFGLPPPPRMPVTNEGLVRDSLLKMVHNPGGDWKPGWGVVPTYTYGHDTS